jgi:hypothetical protein
LLWLPTLDAFFHFDHTLEINEKRRRRPGRNTRPAGAD